MKFLNEAEVRETWMPIVESQTNIESSYKKEWLSQYCHNHSVNQPGLFESYAGYGGNSTQNLANVPGQGAVVMPGNPASNTGFFGQTQGSGDKFPSLLPLAIEVAARTVGFDIVSVIPMNGPTGVLSYLDYVYAGGKLDSAEKPLSILVDSPKLTTSYTVGNTYLAVQAAVIGVVADGDTAVELVFVGNSRVEGYEIWKVGATYTLTVTGNVGWVADATVKISDVFTGSNAYILAGDAAASNTSMDLAGIPDIDLSDEAITAEITTRASLVRALENHIEGFAGAGNDDTGNWSTGANDGSNDSGPMSRGTGETTYYRQMGLKTYTKSIEAKTYQASAGVTTEQIQDLGRQFGIDLLSLVNNALINELSQGINNHILSRAFALGWSNHFTAAAVIGANLNVNLTATTSVAKTFNDKAGVARLMNVPDFQTYGGSSNYENQGTVQRRVQSKILAAANVVAQRGRRGRANFAVTNLQIATALQDSAQFQMYPLANTVNQESGNLYPIGAIAGVTIYVDPNMAWNDNRVLVGRKGADEEPGIKFMPYLMAETIQTIAENTMSPKIAVKTRYALAEAGHFPETMYFTLWVETGAAGIV
jgi:hypothetical protein